MTQTIVTNQSAVDEWDDTPHTMECLTEEELLEFANKIREAGGAELIEALLPSRPNDPSSCLIANALNFTSRVTGGEHYGKQGFQIPEYPLQRGGEDAFDYRDRLDAYYEAKNDNRITLDSGDPTWVMKTTPERAEKIGTALGLNWSVSPQEDVGNIELPEAVGNCAYLFDRNLAFQMYSKDAV